MARFWVSDQTFKRPRHTIASIHHFVVRGYHVKLFHCTRYSIRARHASSVAFDRCVNPPRWNSRSYYTLLVGARKLCTKTPGENVVPFECRSRLTEHKIYVRWAKIRSSERVAYKGGARTTVSTYSVPMTRSRHLAHSQSTKGKQLDNLANYSMN